MSDAKLRDLERRWRETGSPTDETALLVERVRAGNLPLHSLRLAAYLEHEASRQALVGLAEPLPCEPEEHCWLANLADFGNDVCLRAGIAVARCLREAWRRNGVHQLDGALDELTAAAATIFPLLDPVIEASESFVLDRSEEHRQDLENGGAALRAALQTAQGHLPDELEWIRRRVLVKSSDEPVGLVMSAQAVVELTRLAVADESKPGIPGLGKNRNEASGELSSSLFRLSAPLDFQVSRFTYVQAVRSELLPWALGQVDPVRTRVEVRRRGASEVLT